MKRYVLMGALAVSALACAEEPGLEHGETPVGAPKKDPKTEVADTILEHVSDADEFELEFPWGGHVAFPVAEWFPFLEIERVEGACHAPVPASMAAFPGVAKFQAGCWDLRPTKAVFSMWLATAVLFLLLVFGRKRDANGVPRSALTHIIEVLVLFVRDEIVIPCIGKKEAPRYTIYMVSLFFFVTFVNWLGLIPGFFTATGTLAVTAALAVLTFLLTQAASIRSAGLGGYLKHLTGGVPVFLWPIMIPVEVIGLFTKPFALLVRLFANMLGGHMSIFFLLSLVFVWHWAAGALSLTLAVPILILEMFVGILQAYIFTLLSAVFIGQGVAMGHHGHEDHGHEEHAH